MYLEIVAAMQNPVPNVIYNKWQQMSICFYAQILLTADEPLTYLIYIFTHFDNCRITFCGK